MKFERGGTCARGCAPKEEPLSTKYSKPYASITIPVNRRMASIGQQISVQAFRLLHSLQ